jgi:fructuronate reductase
MNRKPKKLIAHIGLGAFHRAHQAWYTAHASDAADWGIVAFTGRSAKAADELNAQNCRYTLITRDASGDRFETIDSIVAAFDGADTEALVATIVDAKCAIVTLTITEAGYGMDANGHVDVVNPPIALHRLAVALETRRRANAAPIAIVSCDNMPSNGNLLKVAMGDLFAYFGPDSEAWLESSVSFVNTSIDRITPRTTEADIALANDPAAVVTEPFRDWVLEGNFPAGRPAWETAGAKFVDHIEQFENRKLWLLNGAHSILAYTGILRGHETVAQAIADDYCRDLVEKYWDEAATNLTATELAIPEYRAALIERFTNTRIAHQLRQIAIDGSTKMRVRLGAVAMAQLASGRSASACAEGFAAWAEFVSTQKFEDSRAAEIAAAETDTAALVALVSRELAGSSDFVQLVIRSRESQFFTQPGNPLSVGN